jgi:YebC/PmpR family DNA-binding regulatory protein
MSGHSKWSTIKRKKGALDAKRGKLFTKILKEISVAAREGGGDPDANARLRLAIQNAKGQNVPKDNIERAITKSTDADASDYFEVTYEGYGPEGVAIFVECATDNLNRTVSKVRSTFSKYGGSLATNGSVEFLFNTKGIFHIKNDDLELESLMLDLIDGGAEEVDQEDDYLQLTCVLEDFGNLQKKLDELNLEVESAELQRIPTTMTTVSDSAFNTVMNLIEVLEDDDDVQKVFHNLEPTKEQLEILENN